MSRPFPWEIDMDEQKLRQRAERIKLSRPNLSHISVEDVCMILRAHYEAMRLREEEAEARRTEAQFSEITEEEFEAILHEERKRGAVVGASEELIIQAVTDRLLEKYPNLFGL